MDVSRRAAMAAAVGVRGLLGFQPAAGRVRIGVTDWNLRMTGKPEAVPFARALGFDGVEVSLGRKPNGELLPLADAAVQDRYLELATKEKAAIAGTCLDILHVNFLKSDPLARKWIRDGIPITKKLNARVMLLPFFGPGAIEAEAEQDAVAGALKDLAPEAEKAGVVLGLENTLSAEANARILDRVGSPALKVYYDVGNSTNKGYDILKEMRWLGKDRICQMHLKDKRYLGDGPIDFPAVVRTMAEIGFEGFANLETGTPSGSVVADMQRNLAYVRKLMAGRA